MASATSNAPSKTRAKKSGTTEKKVWPKRPPKTYETATGDVEGSTQRQIYFPNSLYKDARRHEFTLNEQRREKGEKDISLHDTLVLAFRIGMAAMNHDLEGAMLTLKTV